MRKLSTNFFDCVLINSDRQLRNCLDISKDLKKVAFISCKQKEIWNKREFWYLYYLQCIDFFTTYELRPMKNGHPFRGQINSSEVR